MKQTDFEKDKQSILDLLQSNDSQHHEIVKLYIPRCAAKLAAINEMCNPFKFDYVVHTDSNGEKLRMAHSHFKSLIENSERYTARWWIPDTNEVFKFDIDNRTFMSFGLITFYVNKIGDKQQETAKKYSTLMSGYNFKDGSVTYSGAGLLFEALGHDLKDLKPVQGIFKSKRWRRIIELVSRKLRRYYYTLY